MQRRFVIAIVLIAVGSVLFASGVQQTQSSAPAADSRGEGFEPLGPVTFASPSAYRQASGSALPAYSQAPMLSSRVQSGNLPALSQRLPEEPLVVQPTAFVGTYGGEIKQPSHQPNGFIGWKGKVQNLFRVSYAQEYAYVPNVAKSFSLSQDYRVLTVNLREGMKWSDGAPFTAADVMFWYEDIIANDELTPSKPGNLSPGGRLLTVERVNDYTVRFRFTEPYPIIVDLFGFLDPRPFAPAHYLRQFHARYNNNAATDARAAGYDSWTDWFSFMSDSSASQQNTELPSIDPWLLNSIDTVGNQYFVRNPYYWKVDVAGNQLPYADRLTKMLISDRNVIELNAMNGELTTTGLYLNLENFALYKDNENRGDYTVLLANGLNSGCFGYSFNLTHPDPTLRQIFSDRRFRRAMSLAIDRNEINETFYFGRAVPHQATVLYDSAFYEDWMGSYYAEHDPAEANRLLDEMGLRRGADGIRIGPDGEPISILLEEAISVWGGPKQDIDQLIAEWWTDLGIETTTNTVSVQLYNTRAVANELDLPNWAVAFYDVGIHSNPSRFAPAFTGFGSGVPWATWWSTEGESGEEPPEEIKELFRLTEEFKQTLVGTDEYLSVGKEMVTKYMEGMYTIGTVAMTRWPMLRKNNLGNYLEGDPPWGHEYGHWGLFEMDQWYFTN